MRSGWAGRLTVWLGGFRPAIGVNQLSLLLVAWLLLFYNDSLWRALLQIDHGANVWFKALFLISFFVALLALFNAIVILFGFRYTFKPLAIFLLLSGALVSYFMNQYGAMIDSTMVQNVMETDATESFELLNRKLLFYFVLWGLLPAILVWRLKVEYKPFLKGMLHKALFSLLSLVVAVVTIYTFYDEYASVARNHRQIRHLITPSNYLYSFSRYLVGTASADPVAVKTMGEDAKQQPDVVNNGKKNLMILVVGETARAENFSLNGYSRNTNPRLSQENIINFSNVSSCGTATAVSLPCMFSNLGRDHYSDDKAKHQEGLLDVVAHSNVSVLWRDNNSGCKGACDRIASEDMSAFHVESHCNKEECFDEILLHKLEEYVSTLKGDGLIVLHQKGSHGPAYYKRYPEAFNQFTPVCTTSELQNCSKEEIVNAYDNTILYTDHFLAEVIGFLKKQAGNYNGAMLYVSDHGESLGENNLYLHGLPYFMAPTQQTRVPMIAWLSPEFEVEKGLNNLCLSQKKQGEYSHDNLFHTVLGLMGVSTAVYDPKLDIFSGCASARTQ